MVFSRTTVGMSFLKRGGGGLNRFPEPEDRENNHGKVMSFFNGYFKVVVEYGS